MDLKNGTLKDTVFRYQPVVFRVHVSFQRGKTVLCKYTIVTGVFFFKWVAVGYTAKMQFIAGRVL